MLDGRAGRVPRCSQELPLLCDRFHYRRKSCWTCSGSITDGSCGGLVFTVLYLGAAATAAILAERLSGVSGAGSRALRSICSRRPHCMASASSRTRRSTGRWLVIRCGTGLLGAICAWPVLQNFAAYKVLHLQAPRGPRRRPGSGSLRQLHAAALAGLPDELGPAAARLSRVHHDDSHPGMAAGQRLGPEVDRLRSGLGLRAGGAGARRRRCRAGRCCMGG